MASTLEDSLAVSEEAAHRIIEFVDAPLRPSSRARPDWVRRFRIQLGDSLRVGWYAFVGMADPDAGAARKALRMALAEERGIEPNDLSLRRLPDSHIDEMIERIEWLYIEWWGRPIATSNSFQKGQADGPLVRLIRQSAIEFIAIVKEGRIPSRWPSLSDPDLVEKFLKALIHLTGPQAPRKRVLKSTVVGEMKKIEDLIERAKDYPTPLAYIKDRRDDKKVILAPVPFSDEDSAAIERQLEDNPGSDPDKS